MVKLYKITDSVKWLNQSQIIENCMFDHSSDENKK